MANFCKDNLTRKELLRNLVHAAKKSEIDRLRV